MQRTFFRRANLIDGRNAPQDNFTVVVEDRRISAVSRDADAPQPSANDVIYDLAGRSLMPGMIHGHFHVGYDNVERLSDIDLKHPPTMLALIAAKNAELLLRCGFTGAIGAGAAHYIDVTLKRAINQGLIVGPRMMPCGRDLGTTGDSIDIHPGWWKLGIDSVGRICDGPEEFRKAVRDEIKQGVEIIKLYPNGGHGLPWPSSVMTMTPEEMTTAADTAHERGRKIRAHITSKRAILAGLDARLDLIDHADHMDDECIERLVKQNIFVTPSLYFPFMMVEEKRRGGNAGYLDGEMERALEHSYRMLPKAQAAGVKLLVGDDFGVGPMPHGDYAKELEAYVKGAGIAALDVIGWATRNGAEMLGMKDELGTIEEGKLADLLVINGNPVKDIAVLQRRENLDVIMKDGALIECKLTPAKSVAKAA
ncbi:MAG TPA: amidohydrolase family protein [Candidatus Binataceae bacterium]|nr:amidohydrolase family protein [Candidatus Binataceae bacterium]